MSAIEVSKRAIAAWNRHDADAVIAGYAEDVTYHTPRFEHQLKRQALADFIKSVVHDKYSRENRQYHRRDRWSHFDPKGCGKRAPSFLCQPETAHNFIWTDSADASLKAFSPEE
jgi:nuclear transport factor 2 (NTF2) superfamily protein